MNSDKTNFNLKRDRINREYQGGEPPRRPQERSRPPVSGRMPVPPPRSRRTRPAPPEREVYPYGSYAYAPQYEPPEPEYEPKPKPKKKRKLGKMFIITVIFCTLLLLLNISLIMFRGQLWFNEPRKRDYPVWGLTVSEDLGKINWEIMQQNPVKFAYIRATKGTSVTDKQLKNNRRGIGSTRLLSGYYHEFDFRTSGEKQAENFIKALGNQEGKLRPAVKLTKYGIYNLNMKNEDSVKKNLHDFMSKVGDEYGRQCIIMCDKACYDKYVKPYFSKCTVWYIDHYSEPDEDVNWTLWEYNPRVRSEGYENKKRYFSMTVYKKDKDFVEFQNKFLM